MPNTYECPVVIPWSRPPGDIRSARLAEYVRTVIPQRLLQFTVFSLDKTYHFIGGYLVGMKTSNPFALFGMTRCQIELLAAAYTTVSVIRSLVSSAPDESSVSQVDRALVRFLYGNRAGLFAKFAEMDPDSSSIPRTAEKDWTAVNILTLIDKAAKNPEFETLRIDYDRLCEYLHPNMLSNFSLTEPFLRDGHTWIRVHRRDEIVTSGLSRRPLR
jgi:hypothetical protein